MSRPRFIVRRLLATFLIVFSAVSVGAQSREEFKNLKVLPKDIPPAELRAMMNGFTRALGVRCVYCHVGEEGKPFKPEDFPKDDKVAKRKARVMIQMVRDLNEKYLATIESPVQPPLHVECATCHRGAPQPRMLPDVLKATYDSSGVDTTISRYQALRGRYYGSAVFDFGEVALSEVARRAADSGHTGDAKQLLALNVEMNPKSAFAKRQLVFRTMTEAFSASPDSGVAKYQQLKAQYGVAIMTEGVMNDVGYDLLGHDRVTEAIAALRINTTEYPKSGNAFDSLGEAYAKHGDKKLAISAYTKSLELDPTNDNAKKQLEDLEGKKKR